MLLLILLSFVPIVVAKNELYKGYKVYKVQFSTQEQQDNLHILKTDEIDYWIKPNFKYGVTGLAMVPSSHFSWFKKGLVDLGIDEQIAIEDVYEYLLEKETNIDRVAIRDDNENVDASEPDESENYENVNSSERDESNNEGNFDTDEINEFEDENDGNETEEINITDESEEDEITFGFDNYYRYSTILDHIYKLKYTYENSSTTSIDIVEFGTTEHNRPLVYLKLNKAGFEENKPVIVIEGGINPREWITIPSALKIVNEVLENDQSRYLDNFDWIIIPVVNPDGYEYTHTDLRLWEKNLSTKSNLGFICPGVNINRNFNIDWSKSDSSSSPCSHLYAGTDAVSEIETQLLQNIIDTYKKRIRLYISLQNGGGFISYPWQYEFAASGMFRQNHLLGMEMIAAMQDDYDLDVASVAHGDRASGTSSDYARINDALYVFNIDIVRRGTNGVHVPENEIVNIVEDVWRAVAVAADYVVQ